MTINLGLIGIILKVSFLECSELTHIESGVVYNESVTYDPETEDVIIHVPEHLRDGATFRETLKVDNHLLRMSVWREDMGGHCFSRSLMDFEQPLMLPAIAEEVEARHQVVDSAEMIQVKIWATPEANMTQEEREELTVDMNHLCHGLPIIKMNTEIVDPEEFQRRMLDDGNCSLWTGQTGRKKRQAGGHTQQTCSSGPIEPIELPDALMMRDCFDIPPGPARDRCLGRPTGLFQIQKRSADAEDSSEEDGSEEASGEQDNSNEASEETKNWNLIHLIIGHREIGCE